MSNRPIRLRGLNGPLKDQTWESEKLLRAGRLASWEIVLEDSSVSRRHAEVRLDDDGNWIVRDFNSTNGTYVNTSRIDRGGEHPLQNHDIVQFGKVPMRVELVNQTPEGPPSDHMILTASARSSLDESIKRIAFDRNSMPRAGDQLMALLRAGHHLGHIESEEQLLDNILNDTVAVLDAQRGAIILAEDNSPDPANPNLKLRALAVGGSDAQKSRFHYSKRLTQLCYDKGESKLFCNIQNDEDYQFQSITDGAMSSVLCVLLRTPRKKLGVIHLDRGFFQGPFTEDQLYLADALAANVSAGIECAQLLRKQRELFLSTIMTLAQLVELRDEYTGGHTQRVTLYATMLAEQLELSDEEIEIIKIGTPLHDIGKVGISDEILRAPRRLTPEEFTIMKTHTTLGAEYLATVPDFRPILPIVRSHHERWDGKGYPDGLAGNDIPRLARIVAVADAFDAMTSHRPYHVNKLGKSPAEALREVKEQAGRQFDPQVAEAFLNIQVDIVRVMYEHIDTNTPSDRLPISDVQATIVEPRVEEELFGESIADLECTDELFVAATQRVGQ